METVFTFCAGGEKSFLENFIENFNYKKMIPVREKQTEHKLYYILLAWSASGGAAMMDTVYYRVWMLGLTFPLRFSLLNCS